MDADVFRDVGHLGHHDDGYNRGDHPLDGVGGDRLRKGAVMRGRTWAVWLTVILVALLAVVLVTWSPVRAQSDEMELCTVHREINDGVTTWFPGSCTSLLFWSDTLISQDFWTIAFAADNVIENYFSVTLIRPPASVASITVECDGSNAIDPGVNEGSESTSGLMRLRKYTTYNGTNIVIAAGETGSSTFSVGVPWDYYRAGLASWWSTCGVSCATAPTLAPVYPEVSAAATTDGEARSETLTCRITGWTDADPEAPWLPPFYYAPTPTPSYPSSTPWATPIHWSPVISQTIITGPVVVTPGDTTCYAILPEFGLDGVTVFGVTIGAWSTPEFEICLAENDVGLTVFGWDLGAIAVAAATLGVAGAFYMLLKIG